MQQEILKRVSKLKKISRDKILKKKYNSALSAISICASVLYGTNLYHMDSDLENMLSDISAQIINAKSYIGNEDVLIFYDGFGLNDRGLIKIYLEAVCKVRKVCYITYRDRKDCIPDIKEILNKYNADICYLDRKVSISKTIKQLDQLVKLYSPRHFFYYSVPEDVIATTIMYAYSNKLLRYQINLTDHAFWLGANCIDYCVEFREYGAYITNECRKIDKKKIIYIPFYPMIHKNREFQGYPFERKTDNKVVFSGGGLYKTISRDNKYYEIVDYILSMHKNVIFWYAGYGDDSKLQELSKKYPKRVYFTSERQDLFQILEHSDMYLSTYPIGGGLMFQYAACAGICPITLKSGDFTDGFLINQNSLGIEFDDIDAVRVEISKILNDEIYAREKGRLLKESVISSDLFDLMVKELIEGKQENRLNIKYVKVDTTEFRQLCFDRIKLQDLDHMMIKKRMIIFCITSYPIICIKGISQKIKKKLRKVVN